MPDKIFYRKRITGVTLKYAPKSILEEDAARNLDIFLMSRGTDLERCDIEAWYRVITPEERLMEHA